MSFTPPLYPYERLDGLKVASSRHQGGPIDCSIGTPVDAPPDFVVEELARANGLRGYPPSAGSAQTTQARRKSKYFAAVAIRSAKVMRVGASMSLSSCGIR